MSQVGGDVFKHEGQGFFGQANVMEYNNVGVFQAYRDEEIEKKQEGGKRVLKTELQF